MTLQQVLQDTNYSRRTQISLSPSMYKMANREKGTASLAKYIRDALIKLWELETQTENKQKQLRDKSRKLLTKGLPGKPPTVKEVLKWQKELRRGRV